METKEKKPRRLRWILMGIVVLLVAAAVSAEAMQRWRIEQAVETGMQMLDLPYVWGAEGPDAYDCSGLVKTCMAAAWVETPRQAVEIGDGPWTRVENAGDLRRGDIVCFDTLDDWDQSDHVGIYLGDDQVLHASYGKQKVIISTMGYFGDTFSWGLRPICHFDLEAMICALKPND